jgi:hypothetical protein
MGNKAVVMTVQPCPCLSEKQGSLKPSRPTAEEGAEGDQEPFRFPGIKAEEGNLEVE